MTNSLGLCGGKKEIHPEDEFRLVALQETPARGHRFPTVEFVVGTNVTVGKRCCRPPSPLATYMLPCLTSTLSLMLAILLLAILALLSPLKPWSRHILAYLRRRFTESGAIAALIEEMEMTEPTFHRLTTVPYAGALPGDLPQRLAKLPGHLRR